MNTLKNVFYGIIVGITNLIPGISAGTTIILLGIYDNISIYKGIKKTIYILNLSIGILIGWILFSKLLTFLFSNHYIITIYFFIGLVLFSLPKFTQKMLVNNIHLPKVLIGISIIFIIGILKNIFTLPTNTIEITTLSITIIIDLFIIGFTTGFITIIPGVSGSMFLMIIGKYYTYQTYLSNFSFKLNVIIPIIFMIIGIIIGSYLSYYITNIFLSKHKESTLNIILGLIIGSILIMIPICTYNLKTIVNTITGLYLSFILYKCFIKQS